MCQSHLMAKLLIDTSPLREIPAYRRLFTAISISNIGQQMTSVAVGIQVYQMTHSSFAVGLVGLFQLLPLISLGLFGGALSDSFDRRIIGMVSAVGMATASALLVLQAIIHLNSVPFLYVCVALASAFFAAGNPARQSIIPRIVPREKLQAANSLSMLSWNLGFSMGPLLGGILIGVTGKVSVAYAVDTVAFSVMVWAMSRLPALPPQAGAPTRAGFASVAEGINFLKGKRNLQMSFYIDIIAMVFGMPRALFPAIAVHWYGESMGTIAARVGILTAAPAAGAALSSVFSGPLQRVYKQGQAIVWAVIGWGAAIAAFGLTRQLWVGVLFLAIAGAADNVSALYRTTMLQIAVPDEYRGRLQGIFTVVVAGGPRLGDFEAGTVAAVAGEAFSVISGGLACIALSVLLVAWHKPFLKYDSREPVS